MTDSASEKLEEVGRVLRCGAARGTAIRGSFVALTALGATPGTGISTGVSLRQRFSTSYSYSITAGNRR
jgi:hypothetical protein